MAIKIETEFPGKSNAGDADYPQGSHRDIIASGDGTGTPRTARGQNDTQGLLQKLLDVASITPSGSPDTVLASDYFDALMTLVSRPTLTVATMTALTGVRAGDVLNVAARSTAGNGGGGFWTAIVTGTTPNVDLPNTFNIVVSTVDPLISFILRINHEIWSNQWGADGITFGFDNTPVFDAIVSFVISRGLGANINSEGGEYFYSGLGFTDTGANPHKNGILVPFQGFTQDPKIRFVGHGECIFRANAADLIILRKSTPGVETIGITFEGAGQTNSWGEGVVPEDRDQLVTLVSQSFCKSIRCHYHGCDEGHVEEPGPTVAAAQSGCFYGVLESCDFNQNLRSLWLKGSISEPTNRPTRMNIAFCRVERGNTGFDFQFATEIKMTGNNYQFLDDASVISRSNTAQAGTANTITLDAGASSTDQAFRDQRVSTTGGTGSGQELLIIDYDGTTKIATVETNWPGDTPNATTTFDILLHHGTPTGIYIGRKAENNFLDGGSGEANTNDIFNDATNRNGLMIDGFPLSGVNTNVTILPVHTPQRIRLTTNISTDVPLEVVYDNDAFVKLVADIAGTGTKDWGIIIGNIVRYRTFNGISTFSDDMVFEGKVNVNGLFTLDSFPTQTIAAGAVTATNSFFEVDPPGGAADLNTINGGENGTIITIVSRTAARVPTIKDGVGNLVLSGDFVMDSPDDTMMLIKKASTWYELSRSNNT